MKGDVPPKGEMKGDVPPKGERDALSKKKIFFTK